MIRRERAGGSDRPLYMISVAAELTGMHPQTLRIYERKELIKPKRSSGNTRLYSDSDIEQLRFIQQLTSEGINLAGVMRILELQAEIDRIRSDIERLRAHLRETSQGVAARSESSRRECRSELVMIRPGGLARRER